MVKPRILIHACCAHCLSFLEFKLNKKFEIFVFESNSNIHPGSEHTKRKQALISFAKTKQIELYFDEYNSKEWFNYIKTLEIEEHDKQNRCRACYTFRLTQTVKKAVEMGIDYFSTTLLYSIYQNHDLINELSANLAKKYNLNFYTEDFRIGWKKGFELYRPMKLYMQKYCGCVFSEREKTKNLE